MNTAIAGVSVSLLVALIGGIVALVRVVAELTARATRIEVQLEGMSTLSGRVIATEARIGVLEAASQVQRAVCDERHGETTSPGRPGPDRTGAHGRR